MISQKADVKAGWFAKLKVGLGKSTNKVAGAITNTFSCQKLDQDALEKLEDILIQGDLGVSMASKLANTLRRMRFNKEITNMEIREILAHQLQEILMPIAIPLEVLKTNQPHVIVVCGVNGVGKTTTIGKLSLKFREKGKAVTLVAADTFRAAAVEQLGAWAARAKCPMISGKPGADPAGLVFNAMEKARSDDTDVLIIDTAGRLQNRKDLMDELAKIIRVLKKFDNNAPHDTILVLDATIGQNTINQVCAFKDTVDISGLILTKLDGSAKGGVLVALSDKFKLPVHAVGVGEGIEHLDAFDARYFSRSLLGLEI